MREEEEDEMGVGREEVVEDDEGRGGVGDFDLLALALDLLALREATDFFFFMWAS
jgi:hypothetical protein